jgi:hypothetical protein
MAISATQLTLNFTIFFAIFLDSTGQIFLRFRKNFSLSAGKFLAALRHAFPGRI